MADEMELTAHRRTVEQLLDLVLQLRGELARDAAAPGTRETLRAIRELGERVERQRAALGERAEAGAPAERLGHVTGILEECRAIMAGRAPELGD